MDTRGTKRKHSEIEQEALGVELRKLNNDSAKLNSDMKAAKEDFAMMCKSMTDRQAEILTRGLFVEERHRRVIDLLNERKDIVEVTYTRDEETARPSGNADIRKLARESDESLRDHRIYREIEIQDLERVFKQYKGMLKQNTTEMRERAEDIEKQRRKLSPKLIQLARSAAKQSTPE